MKHESSPIFLLARDLGNLMGVALALPVEQLYVYKLSDFAT